MAGTLHRRLCLIGISILIALGALAVYLQLVHAPDNGPSKGQQTLTRRQAGLLVTGIQIYAEENENALPPKSTWRTEIAHILVGYESLFSKELETRRDDRGVPEFIYVPPAPHEGAAVTKLSDIISPSTYILVYEDYTRVPAGIPKIVAGMADGTTAIFDRGELRVRLARQDAEQARATAGNVGAGPD